MLGHLGLGHGTGATDAGATTGLLLKDLPELQALVGSCAVCQ